MLNNRVFEYKSTRTSPFLEKSKNSGEIRKRGECVRKLINLDWWKGDEQFPFTIHNCILHAIGLNGTGRADSHVRFNWHNLGEVQKSVFLVCDNFKIPEETKREIVEDGELGEEDVKAYFSLAKIFSLAMSSVNYKFVGDNSGVEIFLPEFALVCKTLPFLWRSSDVAFIAFDPGAIDEGGAVLIKKFRLGLSLTEKSFSLFPSFYPIREGGTPIGVSDLKVSDAGVVFPSSLDVLYRLASRESLPGDLRINALRNFIKFDGDKAWIGSLLDPLFSQEDNLDCFWKEFLSFAILAYSKRETEVGSFRSNCMTLKGIYNNSKMICDFLDGILFDGENFCEDEKIIDFLKGFVPQLMFFVIEAELPFFTNRMPSVEFSATRAFLECCAVDLNGSFLGICKKRKSVFESILEKTGQVTSTLCSSAKEAIQNIESFFKEELHLENAKAVEDFLFFKRMIALYFTEQADLEEDIIRRTRIQIGRIDTMLEMVRFYKEKIEGDK